MKRIDASVTAMVVVLFWGLAGALFGLAFMGFGSIIFMTPFISDASATYHVVAFWAAAMGAVAGFSLGAIHGIQRISDRVPRREAQSGTQAQ